MDKDVGIFLNAIGLPTLQGYGLTETSPVLTSNTPEKIRFGTVGVKLDNVDLTQNIEDDGVVYTPKLVNGQITFTKNAKLTRIKKQSERYKRMGLNEWGIDVNANTWAQALRAHLKGKQTFVTRDLSLIHISEPTRPY